MATPAHIIGTRYSSSYINNNLSIRVNAVAPLNNIQFALIHRGYVTLATTSPDFKVVNQRALSISSASEQDTIMSVKWLRVNERDLLVLAADKAIQIYDGDGQSLMFFHSIKLPNRPDPTKGLFAHYSRGIAAFGENLIAVGTSWGHILAFAVPPATRGGAGEFKLYATLIDGHGHSAAICELASIEGANDGGKPNLLISSDDIGKIVLWSSDTKTPLVTIPPCGQPVCGLVSYAKTFIIACFGNGKMKVFSATGEMLMLVDAHARLPHSLDCFGDGLLVTSSDDTYAKVWRLSSSSDADLKLELLKSISLPNSQFVGARFIDSDRFAAVAFEQNDIRIYKL